MRTLWCGWLGLAIVVGGGRASGVEEPPPPGAGRPELAEAQRLFHSGDFVQAGILLRRLARDPRQPPPVVEEARYQEAECLRGQGDYPAAAAAYQRLLRDFPAGACRGRAVTRLYQIADSWLDDTREQIRQGRAFDESGWAWCLDLPDWLGLSLPDARSVFRQALWCLGYVHWDRTKPVFDEEGRALECLRRVHDADPAGPLADRALFLMGSVQFYREDYRGADWSFSRLVGEHPYSPFAAKAIELAIVAKLLQDGGGAEEGRRLAEARQLVETARRDHPDITREFLSRQLLVITRREAARDIEAAERSRHAGRADPARAQYQSICRRYPGTQAASFRTSPTASRSDSGTPWSGTGEERNSMPPAAQHRASSSSQSPPQPAPGTPSIQSMSAFMAFLRGAVDPRSTIAVALFRKRQMDAVPGRQTRRGGGTTARPDR